MHRDGGFVIDDETRSIYTVLIYLNDDFEGGITKIYDDENNLNSCKKIVPKQGKLVMFNHDLFHEAEEIKKGTKYILRTDLMFSRIVKMDEKNYKDIDEYNKAEELYQKSIELQKKGDTFGSTQYYLEAMEIHVKFSNSVKKANKKIKDEKAIWNLNVNKNISFEIILLITPTNETELKWFLSLRTISKSWNYFLLENPFWKVIYKLYWNYFTFSEEILPPDLRIYYSFKFRYFAEKYFQVFFTYFGYENTIYGILGKNKVRKDPIYVNKPDPHLDLFDEKIKKNPSALIEIGNIPSIISDFRGHYWGAGCGINQKLVGKQLLKYLKKQKPGTFNKKTAWDNQNINVVAVSHIALWIFKNGFNIPLNSQEHPYLFIVPFFVEEEVKKDLENAFCEAVNRNLLRYDMFFVGSTCSPFFKIIERELLISYYKGIKNGTVVVIDSKISSVVPIKNQEVLNKLGICFEFNSKDGLSCNNVIGKSIEIQKNNNIDCYKNVIIACEKNEIDEVKKIFENSLESYYKDIEKVFYCEEGLESIGKGAHSFFCLPNLRYYFKKNCVVPF